MTDNVLERLALEESKFVRCTGGRDRHFFSVGETEAGSNYGANDQWGPQDPRSSFRVDHRSGNLQP